MPRRLRSRSGSMNAVEICIGAGGMSHGFARAGFRSVFAIEKSADAVETLIGWQPELEGVVDVGDLKDLNPDRLPKDLDLLAGGPPCQPFSTAGSQLAEWDPRDCFPDAIRFVAAARPRAFIFENVPGLANTKNLGYLTRVAEAFEAAGYHVPRCPEKGHPGRILNAADYGTPQRRQRLFLVGFRDPAGGARFEWPAPTHSEARLVLDKWVSGSYWRRHGIAPLGAPSKGEARVLDALRHGLQVDALKLQPWRTVREAFEGLGSPMSRADLDPLVVVGGGRNPQSAEVAHKRNFRAIADEPSPVIAAVVVGNRGPFVLLNDEVGSETADTLADAYVAHLRGDTRAPCANHEGVEVMAPPGDLIRFKNQNASPHVWDRPAYTVRALGAQGPERFEVSPGEWAAWVSNHDAQCPRLRRLTVRECARLQGFPDRAVFVGAVTSQYRQVGNACPPELAEAVGCSVFAALEGGNELSTDSNDTLTRFYTTA